MSLMRLLVLCLACCWLVVACAAPAARPGAAGAGSAAPAAGSQLTAAADPSTASAAPAPSSAAEASGIPALQRLDPPLRVRIASTSLAAQAPTYLAVERGYLQELGLEPEVINFAATGELVALLSTDQLEVGFQAVSPAMFNAVARGASIRIVADHGSSIPGRTTPSLAVRADLLQQRPWRGYGDLRGMKIALQQLGGLTEYDLELMLQRGGLTLNDVDLTTLTLPDMALAFMNKAIDAAIYNEPLATQQEEQGVIKKIVYVDDVDPNGHVAGLMYSESFARNTTAARNFMVAYLRGIRDYWDMYDGRQDFQPVVDVIKKYTPLKDEALIRKVPPTGQNPAGYLVPSRMAGYQDWFAARGLVPQKVDIERAIDQSFLDYANAVLGPYTPVEAPPRSR